MTHSVVVTGLGIVCGTALGAGEFDTALRSGRCGAAPITLFDTTGFTRDTGCQVPDFDAQQWLHRLKPGELGRAARFAAVAGRMAMIDAGLTESELHDGRGLVSIGTTDGGSHELDQLVADEISHGPAHLDAELAAHTAPETLATSVARELGLSRVRTSTLGTACSAGNYAIGEGLDALRAGEIDYAFCGGADALCRRNFTGFHRLGLLAAERCRPFDLHRDGILTGEGAGVLLLETEAAARARGARIYAEVLGHGLNCDAHHQIAPEGASIARCMRLALDDAGVRPVEVDVISAHATGTKLNDVTECRAIREVFGPAPPLSVGLKSMLGHTMGAASGLAGAACALAISHGYVPPTINHTTDDPECAVPCVPNHALSVRPKVVQSNGLAFGGNNAVVVFGAR